MTSPDRWSIGREVAIRSFLERLPELRSLPLVTDLEMDRLFGDEAAAALAELDRHNVEKRICLDCAQRCCQTVSCELYAPEFKQCPIHDLRPVICRLNFCHRFALPGRSVIDELGDLFLESLLVAESLGNSAARLFDNPPLATNAAELVAATRAWVNAVRMGTIDPESTAELIHYEAERYRAARIQRDAPPTA